jgi:hypothetical protein
MKAKMTDQDTVNAIQRAPQSERTNVILGAYRDVINGFGGSTILRVCDTCLSLPQLASSPTGTAAETLASI